MSILVFFDFLSKDTILQVIPFFVDKHKLFWTRFGDFFVTQTPTKFYNFWFLGGIQVYAYTI